jgi:hypothetical protein
VRDGASGRRQGHAEEPRQPPPAIVATPTTAIHLLGLAHATHRRADEHAGGRAQRGLETGLTDRLIDRGERQAIGAGEPSRRGGRQLTHPHRRRRHLAHLRREVASAAVREACQRAHAAATVGETAHEGADVAAEGRDGADPGHRDVAHVERPTAGAPR